MTREDALNILHNASVYHPGYLDALNMAIKALEQESCKDAVSKQAVDVLVDELARAISDERCYTSRGRSTSTIMQDILDLPSVNPQKPKTGYCNIEPTIKNDLGVDCIDRAQAQTEIELNAFRYTIAKERDGMGQVEWSDQLIKVGDAVDIIRNLPPVTPQKTKTGHWIKLTDYHFSNISYMGECSECGDTVLIYIDAESEWKYCPNCGCHMVVPQESEEEK